MKTFLVFDRKYGTRTYITAASAEEALQKDAETKGHRGETLRLDYDKFSVGYDSLDGHRWTQKKPLTM